MEEINKTQNTVQQEMIVKDMVVRVKSVFGSKITLDKALINISSHKTKGSKGKNSQNL